PVAIQAMNAALACDADWRQLAEKVRAQRAVEQAAMVAGRLAHDFSNYLTGILGFTELTVNKLPPNTVPQPYLKEGLYSAKEGAAWVRKLQLIGRRQAPPLTPVDLKTMVLGEEARLKPTWAPDVTFLAAVAERLPKIAVEQESLRQVLVQLLDNAREAIADK